jgi:hypothetical protein
VIHQNQIPSKVAKETLESVPLSSLIVSQSTSAVSSRTVSPFLFSSLPKRVQNPSETGRKIPIQLQACNCHHGEDQVLNFKASQICVRKIRQSLSKKGESQLWKVFRVQCSTQRLQKPRNWYLIFPSLSIRASCHTIEDCGYWSRYRLVLGFKLLSKRITLHPAEKTNCRTFLSSIKPVLK